MTTIGPIAEGLLILQKYFPDGDVAAEHDVIYAGGDPAQARMTPDDLAMLKALRWFVSEEFVAWAHLT